MRTELGLGDAMLQCGYDTQLYTLGKSHAQIEGCGFEFRVADGVGVEQL